MHEATNCANDAHLLTNVRCGDEGKIKEGIVNSVDQKYLFIIVKCNAGEEWKKKISWTSRVKNEVLSQGGNQYCTYSKMKAV